MTGHLTPTGWGHQGRWIGRREAGEQFTEQQKAEMLRRRGTVEGWDVRQIKVKVPRAPTSEDMMAGRGYDQCYSEVPVDCPIIFRGSTHDRIICPGGDILDVGPERRR